MLVNLPYAYDDLFLPRMGSLTLQAVLVAPPRGGGGGWDAPSLLGGSAQKGNGQLGGD